METQNQESSTAGVTAKEDLDDGANELSKSGSLPVKVKSIVGIGASAGGLEALQELFSVLSSEAGNAYIVVQHLSPDFKSLMAELLSRKTDMDIRPVENNIEPQPDTVYLLPPRSFLELKNGLMILALHANSKDIALPIDVFFESLAKDQKKKAVGVILSGTGSDGSRGIQFIHDHGGSVLVQDPESAKFDGMPLAAVATGIVDDVLTPREIAFYISYPQKRVSQQFAMSVEDQNLSALFDLLQKHFGIDFSDYKLTTVTRQLQRRMAAKGVQSLESYLSVLRKNPSELEKLRCSLLIGVTRFFRDSAAFAALETKVVPDIIKASGDTETIRVWSLGCSSGEEPYSIAITFYEQMERLGIYRDIRIFATDADDMAIAKASAGVYPKSIIEDVSKERLDRYFIEHDDHFAVCSKVRRSVLFARHNIITDPPFSNLDLVTCRNMLIYFVPQMQRRVLSSITFSLKKDGFLFVGSSETLGNLSYHYQTLDERQRLYRKIKNSQPSTASKFESGVMPDRGLALPVGRIAPSRTAQVTKPAPTPGNLPFVVHSNIVKHLLNVWMPPSMLIDSGGQAVYVYGDASRFAKKLGGGRISSDYKSMLREPLVQAVSNAIERAKRTQDLVVFRDIQLVRETPDSGQGYEYPSEPQVHRLEEQIDSGSLEVEFVDLRVEHLCYADFKESLFVVTFMNYRHGSGESQSTEMSALDQGEKFSEYYHSLKRIEELEGELYKSQDNLQVTVEELETTNEELQASNEELMSANEELQSTNEELHSLNEELYTVNSEYQEKISQLSLLNDDYNNILNATRLAIILLDEVMIIRKFTREMTRYFSILDGDIGRPVHHFSHILEMPNLVADIARVFESNQSTQAQARLKEPLQTSDTRADAAIYLSDLVNIDIRPYIDSNNQTCGTVLVITRIPNIKGVLDSE